MLAPTAILLAVFFFYPLVVAIYTSFFEWDLLTPKRYVGIANYRAVFASGEAQAAFVTTLSFSLVVVSCSMALGLALAVLLDRRGKLAAFVRGSIFSAYVVSWVSVALLWLWVLDADAGALSHVLQSIGLPSVNFLGNPQIAPFSIAGVTIWKIAGYAMILFITGLQDIPPELLEAASLDGASKTRRFWTITWPLLRPTAAFVGTTSLILSFQVFDVVRVMTQGGPVRSTTVFVYAIYEQVFMDLRVGRASALVVIFFGLLLSLTTLQLLAWRRKAGA
jgi:sn-glycerol 3-phosphate transport system permease protein